MGHVSAAQPTTRPERLFGALLALFPRDFRDRFGDDMTEIKAALEELSAAYQEAGRSLYAQTQSGTDGEDAPAGDGAGANAGGAPKADDVVEADYEIVDEGKKS